MAWIITENSLGWPRITQVDISAQVPIGSIVRAKDPTYGEGEFRYLLGVTSTVSGSLVTFSSDGSGTCTLSADETGTGEEVGVAMAPTTVSAKYGWYQIGGLSLIKKTAVQVSAGVAIYQSATAGRIMDTVNSGAQILNAQAVTLTTSTTSTVLCRINRPFKQGQVV